MHFGSQKLLNTRFNIIMIHLFLRNRLVSKSAISILLNFAKIPKTVKCFVAILFDTNPDVWNSKILTYALLFMRIRTYYLLLWPTTKWIFFRHFAPTFFASEPAFPIITWDKLARFSWSDTEVKFLNVTWHLVVKVLFMTACGRGIKTVMPHVLFYITLI